MPLRRRQTLVLALLVLMIAGLAVGPAVRAETASYQAIDDRAVSDTESNEDPSSIQLTSYDVLVKYNVTADVYEINAANFTMKLQSGTGSDELMDVVVYAVDPAGWDSYTSKSALPADAIVVFNGTVTVPANYAEVIFTLNSSAVQQALKDWGNLVLWVHRISGGGYAYSKCIADGFYYPLTLDYVPMSDAPQIYSASASATEIRKGESVVIQINASTAFDSVTATLIGPNGEIVFSDSPAAYNASTGFWELTWTAEITSSFGFYDLNVTAEDVSADYTTKATFSGIFKVVGTPTTLELDVPLTVDQGDVLTIKGTLTSEGSPLSGKTVVITFLSEDYIVTTDANGAFTKDVTVPVDATIGPHKVEASYAGDQVFEPASDSTYVFIMPTAENEGLNWTWIISLIDIDSGWELPIPKISVILFVIAVILAVLGLLISAIRKLALAGAVITAGLGLLGVL